VDFWNAVEDVRARWNVLEHPFYQRWSRGELTRDELARYSGQYRHAVTALAEASEEAARAGEPELTGHAAEERSHLALWDDFVRAVGGDSEADALPETEACVRSWARPGRSFEAILVALYAIESGQPAVAETKRTGLRAHYGIDDPRALAYFDVHATRDHEHAALERALLEPRLEDCDREALLAEAESVLRANWELLDGVDKKSGHQTKRSL
jgi:pyrroloquinoline-quinone synthase